MLGYYSDLVDFVLSTLAAVELKSADGRTAEDLFLEFYKKRTPKMTQRDTEEVKLCLALLEKDTTKFDS